MHYIKRYANRRLYHTQEKQYITLDDVRRLVEAGERVKIVDTKTRTDITEEIVSRWESETPQGDEYMETARMISNLIYRGGKMLGRVADAAVAQYREGPPADAQRLFRWAGGRAERSRERVRHLSRDAAERSEPLLGWVREHVEKSVSELHEKMNIAPRDQVDKLHRRVAALEKKLREYEKKGG